MRPLDKGSCPLDEHGHLIVPSNYKQWRAKLIERIGYYCAYCNMPLSHSLQVDHVIPKNPPPGYAPGDPIAWDNMLLACGPCNNEKSNTPIDEASYYFPETHNTLLPFTVSNAPTKEHAIVSVREGLLENQIAKAERTINLFQLDNIDSRDAIVDIRSKRRHGAREAIIANKKTYDDAKHSPTYNEEAAAEGVIVQAAAIGFFNIWHEIFTDEPEVIRQLTNNSIIMGTAANCFDANFNPIPRNPAHEADPI